LKIGCKDRFFFQNDINIEQIFTKLNIQSNGRVDRPDYFQNSVVVLSLYK
jgi:hypothetical protein